MQSIGPCVRFFVLSCCQAREGLQNRHQSTAEAAFVCMRRQPILQRALSSTRIRWSTMLLEPGHRTSTSSRPFPATFKNTSRSRLPASAWEQKVSCLKLISCALHLRLCCPDFVIVAYWVHGTACECIALIVCRFTCKTAPNRPKSLVGRCYLAALWTDTDHDWRHWHERLQQCGRRAFRVVSAAIIGVHFAHVYHWHR